MGCGPLGVPTVLLLYKETITPVNIYSWSGGGAAEVDISVNTAKWVVGGSSRTPGRGTGLFYLCLLIAFDPTSVIKEVLILGCDLTASADLNYPQLI